MALPVTKDDIDVSRVIHHELGHWLMAREMGFSVGQIFIKLMHGKASGHAKAFPRAQSRLDTAESVDGYLSNRIKVLLAGTIVEIEWYKKTFEQSFDQDDFDRIYENGVIDHSGVNDKSKAEELLVVMAGIRNERTARYDDLTTQIRTHFVELYHEAEQIAGGFLEKLFVLAELVSKEPWQGYMLVVPNERLTELSEIADQTLSVPHGESKLGQQSPTVALSD